MISALGVLRWTVAGLYGETMTLLKGNVVWFVLSLPLALPILFALIGALPAAVSDEESGSLVLPLMLTGQLLLILPNPASLGMHRLATTMQRKDSPRWSEFWETTRENVGLGLRLFAAGLLGVVVLATNAVFYARAEGLPLQLLSVAFTYLLLYWLTMQLYLGPLVVYLGERRFFPLYRRAAMLVLAHPIYSIIFLVATLLVMLICLIAVPVYPALAMAFVALMGTRALGQLKQRYDPDPEIDEGAV